MFYICNVDLLVPFDINSDCEMGYLHVLTVCVVLSVTSMYNPATATTDCDLYDTVQAGYHQCLDTHRGSNYVITSMESMEDMCSHSDEFGKCMFDQFLDCDDGTIWYEVALSRRWCNNYWLADWITEDLFPSNMSTVFGCAMKLMADLGKCNQHVEAAMFPSTMGIKDGLQKIREIKRAYFNCGKKEIRDAFQAEELPECASLTWQELYNYFVLTMTVSGTPPLGVYLQHSDLALPQVQLNIR